MCGNRVKSGEQNAGGGSETPTDGEAFSPQNLALPYNRIPYIKGPKKQKTIDFFNFFEGPGPGVRGPFGRMGNVNWVILRF